MKKPSKASTGRRSVFSGETIKTVPLTAEEELICKRIYDSIKYFGEDLARVHYNNAVKSFRKKRLGLIR
jgi:hypothetical protein